MKFVARITYNRLLTGMICVVEKKCTAIEIA